MVAASWPRVSSLVVLAWGSRAGSMRGGPDTGTVGCGWHPVPGEEGAVGCVPAQLENHVKMLLVSPEVCYLPTLVR